MSTTDESIIRSQRIVNLRARMLENLQNGKPSHEGITTEELQQVITDLRSSRAVAGARGGNAKAASAKAKSPSTGGSLDEKLKSLGLDLD